jgi:hypothetical protein
MAIYVSLLFDVKDIVAPEADTVSRMVAESLPSRE